MSDILPAIAALVTAVIGLAIVAVLVSKNAQTPQVLQAASSGLGSIIAQAVSPVTGQNVQAAGTSNTYGGLVNTTSVNPFGN